MTVAIRAPHFCIYIQRGRLALGGYCMWQVSSLPEHHSPFVFTGSKFFKFACLLFNHFQERVTRAGWRLSRAHPDLGVVCRNLATWERRAIDSWWKGGDNGDWVDKTGIKDMEGRTDGVCQQVGYFSKQNMGRSYNLAFNSWVEKVR